MDLELDLAIDRWKNLPLVQGDRCSPAENTNRAGKCLHSPLCCAAVLYASSCRCPAGSVAPRRLPACLPACLRAATASRPGPRGGCACPLSYRLGPVSPCRSCILACPCDAPWRHGSQCEPSFVASPRVAAARFCSAQLRAAGRAVRRGVRRVAPPSEAQAGQARGLIGGGFRVCNFLPTDGSEAV